MITIINGRRHYWNATLGQMVKEPIHEEELKATSPKIGLSDKQMAKCCGMSLSLAEHLVCPKCNRPIGFTRLSSGHHYVRPTKDNPRPVSNTPIYIS
jgi:hypothetical protein